MDATTPPWVRRVGIGSWSFVGAVVAATIVLFALAAISEIVLPLVFAAVLAVIFRPAVRRLEQRNLSSTWAAGTVVVGLILLVALVVIATVQGIVDEASQIGATIDDALAAAAEELDAVGLEEGALRDARVATEASAPLVAEGLLTRIVSGVGTLVGLVSGLILGVLIMYYLLKDGPRIRGAVVAQVSEPAREEVDGFIGDSCTILRAYGRARTVMSAIVATVVGVASLLFGLPLVLTIMVVNFIGGYIPYIGAFLGGGLAVLVALGEGGIGLAFVMLVIVLAANLLLENLVEPKVMGHSLDIHPLVVLVVTALGGVVGGIVGLILAVPVAVIAGNALGRLRSRGFFDRIVQRSDASASGERRTPGSTITQLG
jgi:predicted PurR-regulated permease PerM